MFAETLKTPVNEEPPVKFEKIAIKSDDPQPDIPVADLENPKKDPLGNTWDKMMQDLMNKAEQETTKKQASKEDVSPRKIPKVTFADSPNKTEECQGLDSSGVFSESKEAPASSRQRVRKTVHMTSSKEEGCKQQ